MKHFIPLLALSLAFASASAFADDDCHVPTAQWQTRDAVQQHASRLGWKVNRLKVDDGCYEVQGRDEKGRDFKAKLDPQTLQTVRMQWRDDRRSTRDLDLYRESARGLQAPSPAIAPPASDQAPRTTTRGEIQ